MCLFEKNVAFEGHVVELPKGEHLTPEYLALNPNGVVPTLRHDGHVIHDSSVIMEYLDEVFPAVPLSGRAPLERAHLRAWLRFFEEVPTVAIRIPSFAKVLLKPVEKMAQEMRRANSEKRTLRKGFYRSMESGIDEERLNDAIERLDMTLARMEIALKEHSWLMGEKFTIADICVIPTIDRMEDLGYAKHWAHLPGVSRWWSHVKQRQSYRQTYTKGSRLSEAPELAEPVCEG